MSTETEKIDLDDLTEADQPSNVDIDMAGDTMISANPDVTPDGGGHVSSESLGAIYDVPVQVSAVLGKTSMPISQLIKLGRGAILELDRKVGESIDIVVNNRLVAKGEIVIVDERIGITMTEIIKKDG